MLTFEKLSHHPQIFVRLTGVSVELFLEMSAKIEPLWETRRDNFEQGGRNHSIAGVRNHLLAMLMYYRCLRHLHLSGLIV